MEYILTFLVFFSFVFKAECQDPIVTITQTVPQVVWVVPNSLGTVYAERGDATSFSCYVENKQTGSLVRWQKSSFNADRKVVITPVSSDTAVEDSTKYSIEKPTQDSYRLRLKSLEDSDEGNYTCYVKVTRQTRVSASLTLLVQVAPILDPERTSADMIVKEGDNVDLLCNATGKPYPTIEWTRLGNQLLPIGRERFLNSKLTILNIQPEDRGQYRCRIWNNIGSVLRLIDIKVQYAPRISGPTVVRQAVGYVTVLQCLTKSNPFPELGSNQWSKGTQTIKRSSGRYIVRNIRGAFNQLTYELRIEGVQPDDYGTFRCRVVNSEGSQDRVIQLEQSPTPVPIDKCGCILSSATLITATFQPFLFSLLAVLFLL